jgi:hypothetical protein
MRAKTWNGDRVSGTCDRCGKPTEVSRGHYVCAAAFHAPILCVDCLLSEPDQASQSSTVRRYQLAS